MAKQFEGVTNLDIRDSTPDWDAFLDGKAPADAPNVLVILYDDTGQAAWSPYGGRIEMPYARPAREERPHLRAVAHHLGLLADAILLPDGPEPPTDIVPTILECCGVEMPDVERKFAAVMARD